MRDFFGLHVSVIPYTSNVMRSSLLYERSPQLEKGTSLEYTKSVFPYSTECNEVELFTI